MLDNPKLDTDNQTDNRDKPHAPHNRTPGAGSLPKDGAPLPATRDQGSLQPGFGEQVFRELLEAAPYALVLVDEEGRIVLINVQTERLFGYARDELIGRTLESLLPEPFRDQHRQHRARYTADPYLRPMGEQLELYGLRRDGSQFPAEVSLSPLVCQDRLYISAALRDISQRKRREDELRQLSQALLSTREEERARISHAIHDELGQALTGLKMDVAWLGRRLGPDQRALLDKTQAMSELIDATIEAVRQIATQLRPGILDDMGLVAAVEWQLREFQARSGIHCQLTGSLETSALDADRSTAAFRIFQEALTNVARHAQATRLEVSLEETATHLTLQVRDNGRGMSPREISHPNSIGLLGMRERARQWEGALEIHGAPGSGTTVSLRLPLD